MELLTAHGTGSGKQLQQEAFNACIFSGSFSSSPCPPVNHVENSAHLLVSLVYKTLRKQTVITCSSRRRFALLCNPCTQGKSGYSALAQTSTRNNPPMKHVAARQDEA
eukprot:1143774-Pelagomonas_calceolata.AAC.6